MVGLLKGVPARVLKMEEGGIFVKLWGEFEKVRVEVSSS